MVKEIELKLAPEEAASGDLVDSAVRHKLGLAPGDVVITEIVRRSIDARSRQVKVNLKVKVFINETPVKKVFKKPEYKNVSTAPRVIIVGAGPAGLFAALRLLELGLKPVVLERGKDVRSRRRDLAAINKEHIVNPESNYCFGEGGAGTYSDGKLYTRSKKRGSVQRVLEIMVVHGATEEILVDTHPHIGTNKLPKLVQSLRETIIEHGGEVLFNTCVKDFIVEKDEVLGVKDQEGNKHEGISVILATGHSARDIFYLLNNKKIYIEAKPFALGVRVEHPQELIDSIQYHCTSRGAYLPAASYALVNQVTYNKVQRGVFSFCMCPGGFIVPAATSQEEVVVNGMSPSRRDSAFANSGIVVAIENEDFKEFSHYGPFMGLELQKAVERNAWLSGGKTQSAPAQRMVDFVNGKISPSLTKTSYQPGLISVNMDEVLPESISYRLKQAFKAFGKSMKGYYTNEAQVVGVESRTSSPVFVPRDREKLEHIQVKRLFPCGEGAGYAGGIMSAAIDGEKCAEAVANLYAHR
ncbi:FAD-binding protein [Cytophagaceae bacterium ABcell3]|nr:FAD-binding protein [Cytophagaceae bacterium ABcell3]